MKARKFSWVLNVLTLVAMALGLIMAPIGPASADVEDVFAVEMYVDPSNALAGAHYIFLFRNSTPLPIPGEVYIQFPDEVGLPGAPDYLTFPVGDPRLAQMLISYDPDKDAIFDPNDFNTIPLTGTVSISHPPKQTWLGDDPAVVWVPDHQVRLALEDDIPIPSSGDWMRVDFWGPPTINPAEENAGVTNPPVSGTYTYCVATDEHETLVCVPYDIDPPFPVRLYRKHQIPQANSNYTNLEYIRGFNLIQDALDAADDIWLNQKDYIDEPWWNLFDGCPDLSDICARLSDPVCATEILDVANSGVAIGAVIEVDPGTYNETLIMDTPGVILGATHPDGPLTTTIDADIVTAPVVDISAGAVTLGTSVIQTGPDPDTDIYDLYGFTIRDGGNAANDEDGVFVEPDSAKCLNPDRGLVYDPDVIAYAILTPTNFALAESPAPTTTIVHTNEDFTFASGYNFTSTFVHDDAKIVNLTNGWSGHILTTTNVVQDYPVFTITLDITATDRFTWYQAIAIFHPTAIPTYTCRDARIDIRGNVIEDNTENGIAAYNTAIWVDDNEVHHNDFDGFYGYMLRCCNVVVAQDGINYPDGLEMPFDRTDEMIEISNNLFHDNGTGSAADWTRTDPGDPAGCFDPSVHYDVDFGTTGPHNSGIDIDSTDLAPTCDLDTNEPLYIHDNDIYDNAHAGIWLRKLAASCGVRILWNDIHGNGAFGLSNWADTTGRNKNHVPVPDWEEPTAAVEVDVIFKYNDVYGNGFWGVKNWVSDWAGGIGSEPRGEGELLGRDGWAGAWA
jgi:hypothetical protein